jgi:hypothetical protein
MKAIKEISHLSQKYAIYRKILELYHPLRRTEDFTHYCVILPSGDTGWCEKGGFWNE